MKSIAAETHSILSPSGAHRWAYCTASMQLLRRLAEENKLPVDDSNFAAVGTAAHETAHKVLTGDDWFDHDHFETPDQEEFVPVYINYINDVTIANPGIDWKFEQKVNPAKYVKTNHCKGTADAIGFVRDKVLYVVDYKHGEYVTVEVEDNLQVILYALGVMAKLAKKGYNLRKLKIVLTIVQPRAWHHIGPIREWETTYKELIRWARWLAKQAKEALGPNPKYNPDPEHQCRFCAAQGSCRALGEYELSVAREKFTSIETDTKLKNVDILSHKELSLILRELPALKRWCTKVSEYALSIIEAGGQIPYWDIKEKLGNRQWAVDNEELEFLFDKEVLYERKLRTPAQVEKLAGKGSVDNLTERQVSGNTIVKSDDPHDTEEPIPFGDIDG